MSSKVQLIGGKVLSASDLDKMNKAEVRSRNYKYCTVVVGSQPELLAKVEYSESAGAWEPSLVLINDEWVNASILDDMYDYYACVKYRAEQ